MNKKKIKIMSRDSILFKNFYSDEEKKRYFFLNNYILEL